MERPRRYSDQYRGKVDLEPFLSAIRRLDPRYRQMCKVDFPKHEVDESVRAAVIARYTSQHSPKAR